jgi:hypothetical protein
MKLRHLAAVPAALFATLAVWPTAALACATCGCSLNTDAIGGVQAKAGWSVGLLYTYIDQSQLRRGGSAIAPPQAARLNVADPNSQEVERNTTNNYTTLMLTYSPDTVWHIALQLPFIDRLHSTYGQATPDQLNSASLSGGSFQRIGDAKIIATYQGLLPDHGLGLQLGVKLPTGQYGGQNTATNAIVGHPVNFSSGPNAGTPMDTSLQPGTGSTDVIFGASYARPISQNFDAFGSAQLQVTAFQNLSGVNENYRPGNLDTVSLGLRYERWRRVTPQFQVNLSHKSADQGALADAADSAGTVIYASPGVSVQLPHGISLYGFVQVPVKSWLDGYQLFPRWTGSIGTSYAF